MPVVHECLSVSFRRLKIGEEITMAEQSLSEARIRWEAFEELSISDWRLRATVIVSAQNLRLPGSSSVLGKVRGSNDVINYTVRSD